MDKYEYTVKADKIKQLVSRKDYATAAKIADGIDWSRVQDVRMLMMVAEAFEKNGQYEEAKEVLLTAYDLVPVGKGMLYKLTEICLKQRKIGEAENYYQAYSKAAPNDTGRFTLRYEIACARNESVERRIDILEQFERVDMDERLFYELARLYHKVGRGRECVAMCDRIILWFGEGEYVDAAVELKNRYSGAVAEVRRKQEEATESRRRRIEEMEAEIEELPDPEIPGVEIPEEYFDEPADEEPAYDDPAYDESFDGEAVYGERLYDPQDDGGYEVTAEDGTGYPEEGRPDIWEDPAMAGMTVGQLLGEDPEEYSDGEAPVDAYYDEPYEEDGYEDYYEDDELGEPMDDGAFYGEESGYAEDGRVSDEPIDLSDFVQAAEASGEGPDVEMFSWMNDDGQEGDVGRRIWASLEKAEKDRAFQPDPDAAPAESTEAFSRQLEAALTEEVAAFDDAPAEAAPAEEEEAETAAETPPVEVSAPEISAAEIPAEVTTAEEASPMVFAEPEKEIGGVILPAVHGNLDPAWKARLFSRRFFDEEGFALPEDQLPEDLDDTKRLELPWTYEEQTKKLDELKDIRFGGDALARMNLESGKDLVDPDRFQGDGADYVDLSAVREETEARRAEDMRETLAQAGENVPEHELLCILTEVMDEDAAIMRAMEMIHDAHVSMGTAEVDTAKVTSRKLNSRGMKACLERLKGRDLIILQAGDLDEELLTELVAEAKDPGEDAVVILADTPDRLRELVGRSPELAEIGVYEEESGQAALPFAEAILSMNAGTAQDEPAAGELPEVQEQTDGAGETDEEPAFEYEPEESGACEPEGEPSAEENAPEERTSEDSYEAILGEDFREPEQELSLDEQMAMAFGDSAGSEDPGDTARLGGALAAELARMLDDPDMTADSAETETISGGTKEIRKLSEADLHPAGEPAWDETLEEADLPGELGDEDAAFGDEDYAEYGDYEDYDPEYDEEFSDGADSSFGAIRGFTRYVEEYADSLDCVLDDTAGLAVYACAEELLGDGRPLNAETARELVENAMEQAERTSLRSVFAKKYDKQGRLILREQHFDVG